MTYREELKTQIVQEDLSWSEEYDEGFRDGLSRALELFDKHNPPADKCELCGASPMRANCNNANCS